MKLQSSAFENGNTLPAKYTCDGDNVNPPLSWSEVPAGTKSFALIVDDPDAPSGDFVHWLVWNIPAETNSIAENSVPAGAVQGATDFGTAKWGGPCPPSGVHRYHFKLYALDSIIELASSTGKKELENTINRHLLDSAILIGIYRR